MLFRSIIVRDKKTGKQGYARPGQPMTVALLDLLKNNNETNLVGFYVLPQATPRYIKNFITHARLSFDIDVITKNLKRNKFSQLEGCGYSKYFLVSADNMNTNLEDMLVKSSSTKKTILKQFMSRQKSKLVNRVLLNKFIAEIA